MAFAQLCSAETNLSSTNSDSKSLSIVSCSYSGSQARLEKFTNQHIGTGTACRSCRSWTYQKRCRPSRMMNGMSSMTVSALRRPLFHKRSLLHAILLEQALLLLVLGTTTSLWSPPGPEQGICCSACTCTSPPTTRARHGCDAAVRKQLTPDPPICSPVATCRSGCARQTADKHCRI